MHTRGWGTKTGQKCPSPYVNAIRLHDAVLGEINRSANHPTHLVDLIREAVRLLLTTEGLTGEIKNAQRTVREIKGKIARLVSLLESGGAGSQALAKQLREREENLFSAQARLDDLCQLALLKKAERPDAVALSALWAQFGEVWLFLTEDERTELLRNIVQKVVMENKEKGTVFLYLMSPIDDGTNKRGSLQHLMQTTPREVGVLNSLGCGRPRQYHIQECH